MTDAKTVTVKRRNVYLDVPADAVDKYISKGYDVVDSLGNVIKEHVPNDTNSLKLAYEKHVAEIADLKKQLAELKAENAKLKATTSKSAEVDEATAEVDEPVSKRTKKAK
jgi:hypothetical protein